MVSEKLFPDANKTPRAMKRIDAADPQSPSDPAKAAKIIKNESVDTGLPRLGQITKLRVNIKESIELKVSLVANSY